MWVKGRCVNAVHAACFSRCDAHSSRLYVCLLSVGTRQDTYTGSRHGALRCVEGINYGTLTLDVCDTPRHAIAAPGSWGKRKYDT